MTTAQHIAIDARMIRHSGIGTYLRNLIPRIAGARPTWRFTLLGDPTLIAKDLHATPARIAVVPCVSRIYTIAEQFELARKIPSDATIAWAPHYNAPVFTRKPLVVTIHDVGHLIPSIAPGMLRQTYARTLMTRATQRAAQVICDSTFTKSEIERRLPALKRPARVVHIGVAPEWREPAPPASPHRRPYLLFVGNVKPNKNLPALMRAFASIASRIEHDLVIVGRRDGLRADQAALELARHLGDRIHVTGEVSDDALRAYVSHASLFVFPSLYEGFGLPPLEAMAAGTPCLVSTAASIPEVCGDAAAYFDPTNETELAGRIRELLSDDQGRARLAQLGRARAATFTWERAAEETARAMEGALDASMGAV
jgi:glycosyltransferase involved in cell wall biosynthesis